MRIILLFLCLCLVYGCNSECPSCPECICPTINCVDPVPTEDCLITNIVLGTSRKEVDSRCGEAPIAMRNNNMVIYKYTNNEVSRDFIFVDNELTYDTNGE